jgi:ubiquinone/menaquinone biosynthesis C-methylase UbiE
MSYANAWLKWFNVIEGGAAGLSDRMIELGNLKHARDVLDVGTGIGEPAVSAARALSDGGRVLAIDPDLAMVEIARDRAERMGVSNINFTATDVESMSLTASSFDVVLARWSLMFVEDVAGTLRDLAEALRPGGRMIAAVWSSPSEVPALSLAKKAVHEHFGWPDSAYVLPRTFGLSDIGAMEQIFIEAGYLGVSTELFRVAYEFDSAASFIQYRIDVAGPLWDGMEDEPAEVRSAAFQAIEEALQPYRIAGGRYRIENHAYCIAGQVG